MSCKPYGACFLKNLIVVLMLSAAAASAQAVPTAIVATPEPGTMTLLGAGLVGFGILSLRRSKQSK
jgi:PEP-CTERM motif-containing protein